MFLLSPKILLRTQASRKLVEVSLFGFQQLFYLRTQAMKACGGPALWVALGMMLRTSALWTEGTLGPTGCPTSTHTLLSFQFCVHTSE